MRLTFPLVAHGFRCGVGHGRASTCVNPNCLPDNAHKTETAKSSAADCAASLSRYVSSDSSGRAGRQLRSTGQLLDMASP